MTKGERVLEIRKELKMTLEEFGGKLGVTKTTISRIEKGVNNLTDQMATSICRTYNVNYEWLIYEKGDMFTDLPQTILDELCKQYNMDDFDKQLIDLYLTLDVGCRDTLKKHIRQKLLNMQETEKAAVSEEKEMTVEEAEEAYKKSVSISAPETKSSVSSITSERGISGGKASNQ